MKKQNQASNNITTALSIIHERNRPSEKQLAALRDAGFDADSLAKTATKWDCSRILGMYYGEQRRERANRDLGSEVDQPHLLASDEQIAFIKRLDRSVPDHELAQIDRTTASDLISNLLARKAERAAQPVSDKQRVLLEKFGLTPAEIDELRLTRGECSSLLHRLMQKRA